MNDWHAGIFPVELPSMLKRLLKVDIFIETSKGFVAIELKSTLVWERKYSKGLYRLRAEIGK